VRSCLHTDTEIADQSGSFRQGRYYARGYLPRNLLSSSRAPGLGPAGAASRWHRRPGSGAHLQGFVARGEDGDVQSVITSRRTWSQSMSRINELEEQLDTLCPRKRRVL
jgi:hypothetical protein